MRFTVFDHYLLPVCIDIVLSFLLSPDDQAKQAGKDGDWEYCTSLFRQKDLDQAARRAARMGFDLLVDELVAHGAAENYVLMGACEGANIDICCKWLPSRVLCDDDLCYAAGTSGDVNMIAFVDPRVIYSKNRACMEHFDSTIRGLCRKGHITLVKSLVSDIEFPASSLQQSLTDACRSGCLELVEFLLESFKPTTVQWNSALQAACRSGVLTLVQFMYKHIKYVNFKCVIAACHSRNLEVVQFVRPFIKPDAQKTMELFSKVLRKENCLPIVKYLKHMAKLDKCLTKDDWRQLWFWSMRSAISIGDQVLINYCKKYHRHDIIGISGFLCGKEHMIISYMRRRFETRTCDNNTHFLEECLSSFCKSKDTYGEHPIHRILIFASQACCWKGGCDVQKIQHKYTNMKHDCHYCNHLHDAMHAERDIMLRLKRKRRRDYRKTLE